MSWVTTATASAAVLAVLLAGGCADGTTETPRRPATTIPSPSTGAASPQPAGFPGIWPVTSGTEAAELQQQVDSGSQPWLLEPASVARSYASAELGWTGPQASPVRIHSNQAVVRVNEPGTGHRATVTLVRPLRQSPTGIWVVTEVERSGS